MAGLTPRLGTALLGGIVFHTRNGAIAQLAERFHGMEEVKGSIPFSSTQ